MDALLDNDVVGRLARYGLLDAFSSLLTTRGYNRPYLRLATAPFVLGVRGRRAGANWSDPAKVEVLREFIRTSTISIPDSNPELAAELDAPGIDRGEIQLFAHALERGDCHIFTGDKRAIRALATTSRLAAFAARLRRSVVGFESVMLQLTTELSYTTVSGILVAERVDIGLTRIFSEAEADGIHHLRVSIRELITEAAGMVIENF